MGASKIINPATAGGLPPAGVFGTGSINTLAKFTGATTIANSGISDDGATVSFVARNLASTAAQTWTLASSTTALNIQSGLLNLDTTNSRVGIGTTSPTAPLHVGAGSAAGIVTTGPVVYVSSNGATSFVVRDASNSIESFLYAGSSVVLAGAATAHPYWIRTANTTRVAITATGEVGIGGTTGPTAALDLPASTTALASLRIQSGTAPTSPNNGDIWFDGTNIKMRIGGVTKTFTLV